MQQNDDVVSRGLNGTDSIGGLDNPAGLLYVTATTEKRMTSEAGAQIMQTLLKTTQSCASGCACC